jgi:hypothetical protein
MTTVGTVGSSLANVTVPASLSNLLPSGVVIQMWAVVVLAGAASAASRPLAPAAVMAITAVKPPVVTVASRRVRG